MKNLLKCGFNFVALLGVCNASCEAGKDVQVQSFAAEEQPQNEATAASSAFEKRMPALSEDRSLNAREIDENNQVRLTLEEIIGNAQREIIDHIHHAVPRQMFNSAAEHNIALEQTFERIIRFIDRFI